MRLVAALLGFVRRNFVQIFRDYPMRGWLGLIAALGQISIASVNSFSFSFYVLDTLQRSGRILGLLTSSYLVTETVLKLPFGHLSDRLGRRPFMITGLLATSVLPMAVVLVPARAIVLYPVLIFSLLIPLRMLGGTGSAAVWPAVYAEVPDHVETNARGRAMAVVNAAYAAGIAIGPALAGATSSLFADRG